MFLPSAFTKARSAVVNVSGTTNRSGRIPPPPYTMRPRSVWKIREESTLVLSLPCSAAATCASCSASLRLLRWMVRPLGVYQRAVVSFSAVSGVSCQRLHQPLAERRRAHDEGAVVILQRAGDDLGRGGRAAVHEHHDRQLGPRLRLGIAVG